MISNSEDFNLLLDRFTHALRSPLTAIKGSASLLTQADALLDADSRQELLVIINEESDRLDRAIERLLWLVRSEANRLELEFCHTKLIKLVDAAIAKVGARLQNHRIKLEIPANLRIWGDYRALTTILSYLLDNAAKYSPQDSEIVITAYHQAANLYIKIKDSGCGIALAELEKIFDKHYHAPKVDPLCPNGAGMALAVCRAIVAAHKGAIWLESELNSGSCVTIKLPKSNQ